MPVRYREKEIYPIFEYKCDDCGNLFELVRFISDDDKDLKCRIVTAARLKSFISFFIRLQPGFLILCFTEWKFHLSVNYAGGLLGLGSRFDFLHTIME
jgi:putative FmdB family regulatory protein